MTIDRMISDLRGTKKPAFSIGGVDIDSSGGNGLGVPATKFWYHGLGSLGYVIDHGNVTDAFTLDFMADGMFHRACLTSTPGSSFARVPPPAVGSTGFFVLENGTGADITPTWDGYFDFGAAGPPTIPASASCTILIAYDHSGSIMRCTHNCPAPITPGVTYTDTGIFVCGGAKLGAVIDTAKIANTIDGICTGEYDYSTADDWQLMVHPTPTTGAFELDVRKRTWGNTMPGGGDSVCAAALPILTANGTDFTASGATSTWTGAPIYRGDMLSIAPVTNTALITWWALYIPARRTF